MADSIDDVVNEPVQAKTGEDSLENKVNKSTTKKPSLFKRIIKDTIKFLPWAGLNYYLSATLLGAGTAIFLTPIGLTVGRAIANWKKGKKSTYEEMSGLAKIGVWGATLALAAYTLPDYIIPVAKNVPQMIAKTLIFNPIAAAPWIAWYRATSYIVDKYGTKELFKSFFNFKIFKYTKEAYQKDLKTKLWPTIKETFLTLGPIHFLTMNYIQTPLYRLAIGTGNDILYSMIAGEEGVLKTLQRKFSPAYQKAKSYLAPKLSYKPRYSLPSPSYAR